MWIWGWGSIMFNVDPDFLISLCDRDTSNPPSQVTNPIGTILLGHLNTDGSGGENLNTSGLILALTRSIFTYHTIRDVTISPFRLSSGSILLVVHWVGHNHRPGSRTEQ